MKTNFFLLILVFAVILGLYFVTRGDQQNTFPDYAAWDTYENRVYGYAFKYPPVLFLEEHTINGKEYVLLFTTPKEERLGSEIPPLLSFSINPEKPLDDILAMLEQNTVNNIFEKEEVTLGDMKVLKVTTQSAFSGNNYETFLINLGESTLEISLLSKHPQRETITDILKTISFFNRS